MCQLIPIPDDEKNNVLKVVGRVETVADSQMRRGGETNAMYTITYRVRAPGHPMTDEEKEVNRFHTSTVERIAQPQNGLTLNPPGCEK